MITQILDATNSLDLFGDNSKRAGITYRRYAREIHPDVNPDVKATEAFQKLNKLWDEYNQYHSAGKASSKSSSSENVVYTTNKEYKVVQDVQTDTFFTRYKTGLGEQVLVTSNLDDNDLAENHVHMLNFIESEIPKENLGFYPKIIEGFETNEGLKGVIQTMPNGFVPFSQILKRYPNGIGGRDIGWIFKRVFMVLGMAHDLDIIHAGVSLDSFYIHPEEHGIILNDWQYSQKSGNVLSAVPFTDSYPQKFLDKSPVTPDLDLLLTSKIALELYNNDDWRITRFFNLLGKSSGKNGAFWFNEFNWILEKVYGKPKFHPFTLQG